MSPDYASEVKEVFHWFGIVVHNIQTFEADVINLLLIVARNSGQVISKDQLYEQERIFSKRTLGRLLRELSSDLINRVGVSTEWEQALKLRNDLIYRFFYENSLKLYKSDGCQQLVEELKQASRQFEVAIMDARTLAEIIYEMSGVDPDSLKKLISYDLERTLLEE